MTKGDRKKKYTTKQQEDEGQEKEETSKVQSTCGQIPQQWVSSEAQSEGGVTNSVLQRYALLAPEYKLRKNIIQ